MAKFEVGDNVKIVRMDVNWYAYAPRMRYILGEVGFIVECNCPVGNPCIKFADGNEFYVPDGWFELVEKAKKGWTGKVICTEVDAPCYDMFEVGKVYDVIDGKLISCNSKPYPSNHWTFTSAENIDERVRHYGFIEFKGFAE